MTNALIDPFAAVFDDDDDGDPIDDVPETWPIPGTAKLVIEDRCTPLFISATWTLVASTDNGTIIIESSPSGKAHSQAFIRRWTRQVIRTRYETLRRLGIDAEAEYVKWGGDLHDLDGSA